MCGRAKAASILSKGTRSLVCNGHDTIFWLDVWLGEVPLITLILKDISIVDMYRRVSEYWLAGHGWNWDMLRGLLPSNIENKLAAFILREDEESVDGMYWGPSRSGQFSVKTAYE